MYRNNTKCTLKFSQDEEQRHIFIHCQPLHNVGEQLGEICYEDLFQTLEKQILANKCFIQMEQTEKHIKKNHLLPGGGNYQYPCNFGYISNGAADIISS